MANCPVCKTTHLHSVLIEQALPVLFCGSCEGVWLRANEYARWLRSQTPGSFDESKASEYSPVTEGKSARVCPDCGHFLRNYKVGAKVKFHIDRCNHCNGVWLDKNEWEALKAADLHDEINKIFTSPWQQRIVDESTAGKLDMLYLEKFGAADYEKIKEIREWLRDHPNRNMLLAFLMDDDPYAD